MRKLCLSLLTLLFVLVAGAAEPVFPVKGLCIGCPQNKEVDSFCNFIRNDLAPMGVNVLIIRIDYNYKFESYPQMATPDALTNADVKKIVAVCKEKGIRLIPLVDLLGHQSWAGKMGRLLEVFPEFDETPYIPLPKDEAKARKDENGLFDGELYCKSYCPLHPEVHKVVFSLLGELINAFETDAVHVGMDEVFYLGEYGCPRCAGKDKATLFADEANKIDQYLKSMHCEMWIWGDRLIDGTVSGLGMWEAATNETAPAIDLINKDIVICDWHYERPELTAAYFAQKGFKVATCPWRTPEVALKQLDNTITFRNSCSPQQKDRFIGMVHTDWSSAASFMKEFANVKAGHPTETQTAANTFYQLFKQIQSK